MLFSDHKQICFCWTICTPYLVCGDRRPEPGEDVGHEQRELGLEVEEQHAQVLAHHDPVLAELDRHGRGARARR